MSVLPLILSKVALETSEPRGIVARAMTPLVKGVIFVMDSSVPART